MKLHPQHTLDRLAVILLTISAAPCYTFDPADCAAWNITTVAGGGNGDGGPASSAAVLTPFGAWFAAATNVTYVSDSSQHRVRRIDPQTGTISSIVGTGSGSSAGDGGLAVIASVAFPAGLVTDAGASLLWIAEMDGHRVRLVNLTTGTIATFAGTGNASFCGDGAAATSACLKTPMALAVHPTTGALFISDSGNHRVRVVSSLSVITTVVGAGFPFFGGDGGAGSAAFLNWPAGITWDDLGTKLYIADTGNNRIRSWNATADTVYTAAGQGCVVTTDVLSFLAQPSGDGGPATLACLTYPSGVAFVGAPADVMSLYLKCTAFGWLTSAQVL